MAPLEAAASLDSNWFYSSLAQSAASFVGLFGSILATSVQSQHEPAILQRERATAALRALDVQLRNDWKFLSDYQEHAADQIAATREGMKAGEKEVRFATFYHPFGAVPDGNGGQGCTPQIIEIEEQRLAKTRVLVPLIADLLAAKNREAFAKFLRGATPYSETPVDGMGGVVRKLVEFTERASLELERLQLRTRTTTWRTLLSVLFVVVLVGLIGPLFELSVHNACGWLGLTGAGLFAAGLLVLLVYVATQIARLQDRGRYGTLFPPTEARPD